MGNNTWAVLTNKNGIKVDFASILNKKEAINILNQYLDKNSSLNSYLYTHRGVLPTKVINWIEKKGINIIAERMVKIGNIIRKNVTIENKYVIDHAKHLPEDINQIEDVHTYTYTEESYHINYGKFKGRNPNIKKINEEEEDYSIDYTNEKIPLVKALKLKPTQAFISIENSLDMAAGGIDGRNLGIRFRSDYKISDGHHRWAATILNNPEIPIGGVFHLRIKTEKEFRDFVLKYAKPIKKILNL